MIGNSAYTNAPALPNPATDARDIAAALGRLGFAVTMIDDAGFDRYGGAERDGVNQQYRCQCRP